MPAYHIPTDPSWSLTTHGVWALKPSGPSPSGSRIVEKEAAATKKGAATEPGWSGKRLWTESDQGEQGTSRSADDPCEHVRDDGFMLTFLAGLMPHACIIRHLKWPPVRAGEL